MAASTTYVPGTAKASAGSAGDQGWGVDLYWLPLGAGGWFVRFNGRVYEAIVARRDRRHPLDLYHCALELRLPAGRFVIEVGPISGGGTARGAVREGPVGSALLARFRVFRYELRCWRDGVIPDAAWAVAGPQRVSRDPDAAARILALVGAVPTPVWGRDELGTGEMWNSNSVVAWLLAQSGFPTESIRPPAGGRPAGTPGCWSRDVSRSPRPRYRSRSPGWRRARTPAARSR